MTDREMADALRKKGWGLVPPEQYLIDMEPEYFDLWNRVMSFTMTSPERGYSLFKAVEYLCGNGIAGDFVECGVWRGGSCMLMALALQIFGESNRHIALYDTFAGMTAPTDEDLIAWNKRRVLDRWGNDSGSNSFFSWAVGIDEVRDNMSTTGYDFAKIRFIPGDICETIEGDAPDAIALLRLDTDWYASTSKELEVLFPRLVSGGVLIIDDYGHFIGARKAVDEYFDTTGFRPYLSRTDYTGRILIKP